MTPVKNQRTCSSCTSTSSYSSKLDSQRNYSCIYARWNSPTQVATMQMWSPASSPLRAGECDKCACLVGERFSGPEWNALHGLRIQRSMLLDVHGFLQLSSCPTDKLAKEMTHDLEVNFNRIAPVRKADAAKELQDHAVENAEMAEIKRAVFRALTHLRAATIKEFDTIDSQVRKSSHRRVQHWTATHGLLRRFQRRLLCRCGLDLQTTQCGQDLRHVR